MHPAFLLPLALFFASPAVFANPWPALGTQPDNDMSRVKPPLRLNPDQPPHAPDFSAPQPPSWAKAPRKAWQAPPPAYRHATPQPPQWMLRDRLNQAHPGAQPWRPPAFAPGRHGEKRAIPMHMLPSPRPGTPPHHGPHP